MSACDWYVCYVWFLLFFVNSFFNKFNFDCLEPLNKSPSRDQSAPPRATWLAPSSERQIGPQSLKCSNLPVLNHVPYILLELSTLHAIQDCPFKKWTNLPDLLHLAGQPGPPHSAKQTRASKDHERHIGKEQQKFQDFEDWIWRCEDWRWNKRHQILHSKRLQSSSGPE